MLGAAATFSINTVEQLRKDFLVLMKSAANASSYLEALEVAEALARFRTAYDDLIYERLIKAIPEHVAGKKGLRDRYDSAAREEIKEWQVYWEKELRPPTWGLSILLSSPLEREGTYRLKWKGTDYEGRPVPFDQLFADYARERTKWIAKAKREAPKAWKALTGYLEWLGATPAQYNITEEWQGQLEGFQVLVTGFDDTSEFNYAAMAITKEALRGYRHRAERIFPWLLQHALLIDINFICDLDEGGSYHKVAGRNRQAFVRVCPSSYRSVQSVIKTIAHEMGHHVWQNYLSTQAQDFWSAAVGADRGELDLVELSRLWHSIGGKSAHLEQWLATQHPYKFLQVQTLLHGYAIEGSGGFISVEELDEVIARGTRKVHVPNNPITAYASKNTQEAFCEAFGLVFAYGPGQLPPLVLSWLQIILPELRVYQGGPLRGAIW